MVQKGPRQTSFPDPGGIRPGPTQGVQGYPPGGGSQGIQKKGAKKISQLSAGLKEAGGGRTHPTPPPDRGGGVRP